MTDSSASQATFIHLVLKTFAGLGGGIIGTAILVVIYLIAAASLQPVLLHTSEPQEIPPFFIFIIMFMIFLGALGANLVSSFLFGLSEKFRYTSIGKALGQIFIINLLVFIVLIPVYLIASKIQIGFASYAAGLHVLLSAQASALVLEMVSNTKYAVLGIYATILATLFSAGLIFLLYTFTGSAAILLFTVFPILWISIGLTEGILELIYGAVVSSTGKDFLAVKE